MRRRAGRARADRLARAAPVRFVAIGGGLAAGWRRGLARAAQLPPLLPGDLAACSASSWQRWVQVYTQCPGVEHLIALGVNCAYTTANRPYSYIDANY